MPSLPFVKDGPYSHDVCCTSLYLLIDDKLNNLIISAIINPKKYGEAVMGLRYMKSINLSGGFRINQRYHSQNCLYSGGWYILCRWNRQEFDSSYKKLLAISTRKLKKRQLHSKISLYFFAGCAIICVWVKMRRCASASSRVQGHILCLKQ